HLSCRSLALLLRLVLFLTATAPPSIYPLSLHDALPICSAAPGPSAISRDPRSARRSERIRGERSTRVSARTAAVHRLRALLGSRSEEHTSELQSRFDLVCRLLLEKKKKKQREMAAH